MKTIQLSMVVGTSQQDPHDHDIEREGEDDGITLAADLPPAEVELTTPTTVIVEHIRNFYPRKKRSDGYQPLGTRITFANGSGMAVTETYETVRGLIQPN